MLGAMRVPSAKRPRTAAAGGCVKRAKAGSTTTINRTLLFGLDGSRGEMAPTGFRCRPGRGDGSLDAAYFNDGTFVPLFEPCLRKITAFALVPRSVGGGEEQLVELSVPPLAKGGRSWSRPWTPQERQARRELVLRLFEQDADFFYSDASLTPRIEDVARAVRRGGGGGGGAGTSAASAFTISSSDDDAPSSSSGGGSGGGSSSTGGIAGPAAEGESGGSCGAVHMVAGAALRALRPICQTELQGAGETGACMAAATAHLLLLQGSAALLRGLGGRGKVVAAASAAHTQALQLHRAEQQGRGALADQGLETLAQFVDFLPATAMAPLAGVLRYQELRAFYDTNYHAARFAEGVAARGAGDAITAAKVRWLEGLLRGGRAVVLSVAKLAHCMLCVGCSSRHLLFVNSFGEDTEWGGLIALDKLAVVANIVDAVWLADGDS